MEIFTSQFATTRGYTPGISEEFPAESDAPSNRLTSRELKQLRSIREEIEARPNLTRFEKRYARLIKIAEQEFCGIRSDCIEGIARVRKLLKEAEYKTDVNEKNITIAFLVAAIAKYTK